MVNRVWSSWRTGVIMVAQRMFRAARFDGQLYDELAADPKATGQAFLVVLLVALATGIGSIGNAGWAAARGLPGGLVLAFIGWAVGAYLAYAIGTKLAPASGTKAGWSGLARARG